ncbi:MAG TPA: glycosyltransferase family 39 protein [Polyangia bacterium]|nr:glycosyltransferase family 39 protein [Polyangia bacterium]
MDGKQSDCAAARPDLPWIAALFAAGFSLCALWIVVNPQRPTPDASLYESIGANLAAGNGFSHDSGPPYRPELTRTPLVPGLTAVVYSALGREPAALLWINALLVAGALVLGYLAALRLFHDRAAALAGSVIALVTPPVAGAVNNVLTEAPAMFQVALAAVLLLGWRDRRRRPRAWLGAGAIGLVLASLVLNRPAFAPAALIAAAWVGLTGLAGAWRARSAWIPILALAVALGAPVLAWSARNASVGLPFSPAPVGGAASRVYDLGRWARQLGDPPVRLPEVNRAFFDHWKRPRGPQELIELDRANGAWLDDWLVENGDRWARVLPARLLGLFSDFRISIWPPWDGRRYDRVLWPILAWISRGLWLLSLLGFVATFRRPAARWIWLGALVPLVAIHAASVCNPRYLTPLLPLLMPYGGAAILWIWRRAAGVYERARSFTP